MTLTKISEIKITFGKGYCLWLKNVSEASGTRHRMAVRNYFEHIILWDKFKWF